MSLINDALKRARLAQQKTAPPLAPGVPLRPVEIARPKSAGLGMLLALAVLTALVIVFMVLWAVGQPGAGKNVVLPTTQESKTSPTAAGNAPNPTLNEIHPKSEPAPATIPSPAVSLAAARETNAAPLAVASPPMVTPPATTSAPAVRTESPSAAMALPKLQGVVYRPDRPSALLSGRTVLIGERSGEFLVVAIDPRSVTLVRAGVTNILHLAE